MAIRQAHRRQGKPVRRHHLTAKGRRKLKASQFGLSGIPNKAGAKGILPMPDKAHARAAKARASMMEHQGTISEAQEEKVDRKADKKLRGKGK